MKGNQKVAKKKGVPNERRRLSLRPRPSPIAKTPVEESKAEEDEENVGGNEDQEETGGNEAVEAEINEPAVKEYMEEEKQSWVMVIYKGCEERMDKTDEVREAVEEEVDNPRMDRTDAAPKKRGRPRTRVADAAPMITGKRKCEPSQWVQTPFTAGKKAGKKRKTKA